MADVVLCLGTNLGDRVSYMQKMEQALEEVLLPPISKSSLMETGPLGVTADHPWYYNRLVRGRYNGTPRDLLKRCQAIEQKLGRTRPEKYAPSTSLRIESRSPATRAAVQLRGQATALRA